MAEKGRFHNPVSAALAGVKDLFRSQDLAGAYNDNLRCEGKVCLVTGASSGVGEAIAVDLARRGAQVIMACRSQVPEAAERVRRASGSSTVDIRHLDLTDLDNIHAFCDGLKRDGVQLDVAIFNAGVATPKARKTASGLDEIFLVNFLSKFITANRLLADGTIPNNTVAGNARPGRTPRMIYTSSDSHQTASAIDFEAFGVYREYGVNKAIQYYSYYKLVLNTMNTELARRLQGSGQAPDVSVHTFCPGPVNTNIIREAPGPLRAVLRGIFSVAFRTPAQGAMPATYLSCSTDLEGQTNRYLHMLNNKNMDPKVYDAEAGKRLWDASSAIWKRVDPARARVVLTVLLFWISSLGCWGNRVQAQASGSFDQPLQPGLNWEEVAEMLRISVRYGDSAYVRDFEAPRYLERQYRSASVGLDNMWELWTNDQGHAVINVRGSTVEPVSWLANFYAAMTPAQGMLLREGYEPFRYRLADDPKAAVHTGWLIALAYLEPDILTRLDSCYQAGIRNLTITGHSQGGAIAYLLTAHLGQLRRQGRLPSDWAIKTYCTAAPKPGNLYFAYDYEYNTRDGWAFNVVNAADWVPEVPVSLQRLDDFNLTSPFPGIPAMIREQKFPVSLVLRRAHRKLDKPSRKAVAQYQKYMGEFIAGRVQQALPELSLPPMDAGLNYSRTGVAVVLRPDAGYFERYPDQSDSIFLHHFHQPYWYLLMAQRNDPVQAPVFSGEPLHGNWQLTYISGPRIAFDDLYPERKPTLTLDTEKGTVNGNTSCNSYSGHFARKGMNLTFPEPFAMTRMACPGLGESVFLQALQRVDAYGISPDGQTLTLLENGLALLAFSRLE
jgi:NAD(P)-dependent dehydrogenase (short-subunit alcohol dehydrogenase family)/heat shock protein HslJ